MVYVEQPFFFDTGVVVVLGYDARLIYLRGGDWRIELTPTVVRVEAHGQRWSVFLGDFTTAQEVVDLNNNYNNNQPTATTTTITTTMAGLSSNDVSMESALDCPLWGYGLGGSTEDMDVYQFRTCQPANQDLGLFQRMIKTC